MSKENKKPFPSFEDSHQKINELMYHQDVHGIYNYFTQFQYEKKVMYEVGDMVEGCKSGTDILITGELQYFIINGYYCDNIRPIQPNKFEELKKKYHSQGLSYSEGAELLRLYLEKDDA